MNYPPLQFDILSRLPGEDPAPLVVDSVPAVIGSNPNQATLVVGEEHGVEPTHARIVYRERKGFVIEDRSRAAGLLVKDQPVQSHPLAHGDVIALGHRFRMQVVSPGNPAAEERTGRSSLRKLWWVAGLVMVLGVAQFHGQASSEYGAVGHLEPIAAQADRPAPALDHADVVGIQMTLEQVSRDLEYVWQVEPSLLNACRGRLAPWVGHPGLGPGDTERLARVKRRIESVDSLHRAIAELDDRDWLAAAEALQEVDRRAEDDPKLQGAVRRLARDLEPLMALDREIAEALEQGRIRRSLIARVRLLRGHQGDAHPEAQVMEGVLSDLLHEVVRRELKRVEDLVSVEDHMAALKRLRALEELNGDEHEIGRRIAELQPVLEPQFRKLFRLAYLAEQSRDQSTRAKAIRSYRAVLALCAPHDWTAEYHRVAQGRLGRGPSRTS